MQRHVCQMRLSGGGKSVNTEPWSAWGGGGSHVSTVELTLGESKGEGGRGFRVMDVSSDEPTLNISWIVKETKKDPNPQNK